MKVEKAFSGAAKKYDEQFTNTTIGRLQRNRVWNYLNRNIDSTEHPRVLELNCGTGEDAKWLASKGFRVTATDLSPEMIAVAKEKNKSGVEFEVSSFAEIGNRFLPGSFDFVFSNFGGLNCASEKELRVLAEDVYRLLKPDGRFIAVVMSDDCAMEKWYFRRKKMYEQAVRRKNKDGASTTIEGETFKTYYYSPAQFASITSNVFRVKAQKAVGWTIPPSYTDPFFQRKPLLLKALTILENTVGNIPALAKKADHFLIDLLRK
jgi:ubiquinone/menaquinone biosynthesis C-methylase UbiE